MENKSYSIENFIVVWLDTKINLHYDEYRSIVSHLQQFVNCIIPITDSDRCIDLITDINHEKIFLIISGSIGQKIVPLINNLNQIDSIYIFCESKSQHEKWANKFKKIKGVFTKPQPIYDALRRDLRQGEDDLNSFCILSSRIEDKQLFIYIQLLKEILIEMEYKSNTKIDFAKFSSCIYQNNPYQSKIISEFQNNYDQSSSIWWFTRESFISSILNKAFRIRNIEMLIKMGFFIRDIHQKIQQLSTKSPKQNQLIVYRGQGIIEEDFNKILENQNGFISFNNFLITTTDKDVSLTYARNARDNHELIGILFQMEIDQLKALCIPLNKISYYSDTEKDILFSIQNIFRIETIHPIENGLWQVKLRLTNNEDEELMKIKKLIQDEVEGKNLEERLELLLHKLNMRNVSKAVVNEPSSIEMEIGKPEVLNQPTTSEEMEIEQTSTISNMQNEQPDNIIQKPPDS